MFGERFSSAFSSLNHQPEVIAANRIDRESLQADAAPFGIATALAVGEVFSTSLPPGLLTTARWTELVTPARALPEASRPRLQREYRLRAAPLGNGQLLVAVPLSRVQPFRSALLRLSLGLVLLVVMVTLLVVMWLLGRALQPLGKLTRAAELVSRGQLARSRPLVTEFTERRDEIGGLARSQLAATARLATVVKLSQRLARHIEANVDTIDGVAKAVATGAARQEERLWEVTSALEPLTQALVHTSQGLQDAHNIVTTLALSSSAADQTQAILATAVRRAEALLNAKEKESLEPRALRTASVLQQASVIAQAVTDQREVFLKVRECVAALRSCIDASLESQLMEQHHGQHAHRATTEIGRLAKLHAQDAASLRASSEQLRQELLDLQKQLATLDTTRSGEEGARPASEDRQSTGERSLADEAKRRPVEDRPSAGERSDAARRRPDRPRSSQSLSGPSRRSIPGISSSQSLAPVPGHTPAAERRPAALPSTHSAGGLVPVSRSSGNFPKVGGAAENVPSGTSLRPGFASSLSGGGGPSGKGPGVGLGLGLGLGTSSGTSLGGSSGNQRPVASSVRSLGPASGSSLNSSSGTVRPVAGSRRSLGQGAGSSLGGSSGTVRPVSGTPHGGTSKPPPSSPGDAGVSTRSLRLPSEAAAAPSASAQSLNSSASLRQPGASRGRSE